MRTVLLLLLAMLVVKTTSAQGQSVCSQSYVSCLDKCVSRLSKTLQDTCIEACQSQNNGCFSRVLGAPGPSTHTVKSLAPPPQQAQPQQAQQPQPQETVAAQDEERPAAKPAQAQAAKPAQAAKAEKPAMKPAVRRTQ